MKTFFLIFVFIIYVKCDFINPSTATVAVKEGLIQGRPNRTVSGKTIYYAFQGIPYAEAPVGHLRFEPPVPKKHWSLILDATTDKSVCTQGIVPVDGSEDCLFINVYVPKVSENLLLPVLVFIPGQSFKSGVSHFDVYGPDFLLDEKIIVVTLNYRLGIFGFLSTGDLVVPGNNGLKDQLLALKWLQNNIEKFGGDPQKVTISGHNAGAASASYHMQSPQSNGLFRGVILQSGSSLSSWALYRTSEETNYWLGREFALNPNNSRAFVEGLKRLNYSELQTKSQVILTYQILLNDERRGLVFGPVIEPPSENAFITARSHELLQAGNFSHVPLLIGYNSLEALDFKIHEQAWILRYDIDRTRMLPIDLNINPNQASAAAATLKNHYISKDLIAFAEKNLTRFLSDDGYARPAREYVRLTCNRIPVYFYKFSYYGKGNVNRMMRTYEGVGHSEELTYIWNVPERILKERGDTVVRDKVVAWWANFVKFGNPTPPTDGAIPAVIWPTSDDSFTYLDIDTDLKVMTYPDMADMELWDYIYSKYGNPPYDTY